MNRPETPPIKLGGHCCTCSNERGSICGHIGGPFLCVLHRVAGTGAVQNPFITPDNPTGHWDLPYEEVPGGLAHAAVAGIICDSVDVTAGVSDTPLGRLPVLLFDFHSSAHPPEHHPPRIIFIGTVEVLASVRDLIVGACTGAIKAAGGEH